MIDLSIYAEQTEELKLLNGNIIHLRKPTQKIILDMMNMEVAIKGKEAIEQMGVINNTILAIINNNADNEVYSLEFVEENFSFDLAFAMVQSYMGWATKIQSQNF